MRVSQGPQLELLLHATADERDTLVRAPSYREQESEVATRIREHGYEFVAPGYLCALTDSPIIGKEGDYWWFPRYMIENPWETLGRTGQVCFMSSRVGNPE